MTPIYPCLLVLTPLCNALLFHADGCDFASNQQNIAKVMECHLARKQR